MPAATVTSKGQVTIPAAVRRELDLHAGDRVDFVRHDDGTFTLRPAAVPTSALKGFFEPPTGPAITLEEMDAAIAEGAAQ